MFKYLTSKGEDPGFPNAVILTNRSEHWLDLDDDGRRIPPRSHIAMDSSLVAKSVQISEHINAGLLVLVGGSPNSATAKPKRRKKQDERQPDRQEEGVIPVVAETPVVELQPAEPEVQLPTTLVAEPEPDNWVSSTENIVGEPTPDQI